MDIATRYQPRARAGSYRDQNGDVLPEDSGGESESNLVRRKFQRTVAEADPNDATFRKPSLPASALRQAQGLEHRPSLSQRRRTTLRENVRVPSGPREFPSPGKQRMGSTSSTAPSVTEATNTTRSYLPQSPFFYNLQAAGSNTQLSFPDPTNEDDYSPTTPADDQTQGSERFAFLPDVNFDDFQTTIKDYEGNSPLLSDFPSVSGGKILPKEEDYSSMARQNGYANTAAARVGQQQTDDGLGRTLSLRQRLAGGRQTSGGQQTNLKDAIVPSQSSWASRRKSSAPQNSSGTSAPPPMAPTAKQPRKSVGPGLITSMMKGEKTQQQTDISNTKPGLARNSSFNKRRTTIQPSASAGAELPRLSTLTATTQSRQNKVKSLQPPPRDQEEQTSTPSGNKSSSKNGQNRAHTPSSSGNKRQSMASGRASGLGARTVSPTDARRLKRISMMNPPPMPAAYLPRGEPTPPEEKPNPMLQLNTSATRLPELPRLAQPSPSLIPRKTSNATPSSARASPEGKPGGVSLSSLSSKSSYQSLSNASMNGSTSRLPTPKPRNVQSSSAMANYSDQYGEQENEELVPPVPAIPKAYESPREEMQPPFFSSSMKSSQSGFSESAIPFDVGGSVPTPWMTQTPRTSFDVASDTPRKRSGEYPRTSHQRTNPLNNGANTTTLPASAAPQRTMRAPPEPNGRKNANLQALRLPPLNLIPWNTSSRFTRPEHAMVPSGSMPRPSDETDTREEFASVQTPEPRRTAKTPSTPMTASKATFFRRQEEKALRSSSSHYALRDVLGMDAQGNITTNVTKFWDDSDYDSANGVPIPKQRSAITPFASGSLPKGSREFLRGRPSGEYTTDDEYNLGSYENLQLRDAKPLGPRARAQTGATMNSMKSGLSLEPTMSMEEQYGEPPSQPEKKESTEKNSGGGLRRKLSMGWRRSSSKSANHAENKNSPRQGSEDHGSGEKPEKEKSNRLQKRHGEMPPPKLPASATWTGDVPALPTSTRPSFDSISHAKRKSQLPSSISSTNLSTAPDVESSAPSLPGVKTRSQHSEQPTPVTSSSNMRNGSGGTWRTTGGAKPPGTSRHKFTGSGLSVLVKDKDDLAADEEMSRLSRKRKDVDSAARESEELKKRAIARSPVNAEHVLHDRSLSGGSGLNVFERGEIVDYEKEGIYFTGAKTARKIIGTLTPSPTSDKSTSNNFGYDDERGDYNIIFGDHLAYRYEVVDILGKGSFGQVVRCIDHKGGGLVAVKIIRNKKRFHQQALVEVGILGKLRDWDPDGAQASLSITTSFYFRSHLCIVTPCLSINLYELIRAHNFIGFPLPLIRRFARQLLACLVLLQSKRIIHCDLKPENILLCEARKADVRVIDFGSSCREEEKVYTYIQSRFYRSPEVILGSSYGLGIDMWSLGCILAELWTGYPIFPGENEQEQLACIMEIFGPPDRHLVDRCTRKKLFFDSVGKPRVTVSSKGRRRRPSSKTLQQALKSDDEAFLDFISRCLRWDPDRRLKPSEASSHPFVTNQPLHQRSGIPDEARRAARIRSTAAVPAPSGQGIPSPVKRGAASTGNAFAQQQTSTPARDRTQRTLPETPQTAVRNPASSANNIINQGSPVKSSANNANRRQSTVQTAGAAAMAGNKRASNGAVLAGGVPGAALQQQQRVASGNLAQMAASASMGANAAQSSASRWRA